MTDDIATIEWGDLIPLHDDNWKNLPDSTTPYYVQAKEGTYLHRRIALGRGIVRTYKTPSRLQPVGNATGAFQFDADPIPAAVYAQAVSFFRRIWNEHKTEAEVLITQHIETKEYRLFIPTQRVSHGGVYSIYNVNHIDPNYLVVGTFHSHCDFSPYHSSTDEGDAKEMDGIHGTIGFLDREVPEMALMIGLSGSLFHFTPPFDGVVDMSDLTVASAPAWWDRFVLFNSLDELATMREQIAPYASDEHWDRFMGKRKTPPPQQVKSILPYRPVGFQRPGPSEDWTGHMTDQMMLDNGYIWDSHLSTYRWQGHAISRESARFNAIKWGPEGDLLPTDDILRKLGLGEDHWEDILGKEYIDNLFDTGLVTEDDIDDAFKLFPESATREFWERRMRTKLLASVTWLRHQGFTVTVQLKDERPTPVTGQTTVDDYLHGELPV